MTDAAALAGRHLDLVTAPFTLPRSRVLVFRAEHGEGVRVHTSEYERRLSECRVLDALVVVDAAGAVLPVTDVHPARVTFGDAAATLTFADPSTLSLGENPGCGCGCGDRTGVWMSIRSVTGFDSASMPIVPSSSSPATMLPRSPRRRRSGPTGSRSARPSATTCRR